MSALAKELASRTEEFTVLPCRTHKQWLQARCSGIGASEAAALYGVSPFDSLWSLWVRKFKRAAVSLEETQAMEWGHRLEAPIARAYADKTDRALMDLGRRTILQSRSHPFMFATLDRVIDGERPGVLEIKSAGEFRKEDWANEQIPLGYQVQVQHQLAVTGFSWASIAVLIGGNKFEWRDIDRNEEFIADLRERCAAFWRTVESGVPPAVDASAHTTAAIRKLYAPNGEEITLPVEAAQDDDELQRVKEALEELGEKEALLKNRIRAALGNASSGVLPSGARWTITKSERAGYTVKPTTSTTMRRINAAKPKQKQVTA